ncbi:hypothetical protein [Hoeflea sp. TYP-13]|uniref:hypothetical protein n=1 Tax=Hoeflea sp. TYP-13 TaxID=3230023 RepID=UPI0034C68980
MDDKQVSVAREFTTDAPLKSEDLINALQLVAQKAGRAENGLFELRKVGSSRERETLRSVDDATRRAQEIGDSLEGIWASAGPYSLTVRDKGKELSLTVTETDSQTAQSLIKTMESQLQEALPHAELKEADEPGAYVELAAHAHMRHIYAALYRPVLEAAIDALATFDPQSRSNFWIRRRGATSEDPAPLTLEQLGAVLQDEWQAVDRVKCDIVGQQLHIIAYFHVPRAWLDLVVYAPVESGSDLEILTRLGSVLDLKKIPFGVHQRSGTATFKIKDLNARKLASGLRLTEVLLRQPIDNRDTPGTPDPNPPGPDDLPAAILQDGNITRDLYDHEAPKGPMEVLEDFPTLADLYARLEEEPRGLRTIDFSIVGAQERSFNLRVNVVEGLMSAWSNTSLTELSSLLAPVLDRVDATLIDGRPGTSKSEETPFAAQALKAANSVVAFLPALSAGVVAIGAVATVLFASARVEVTHPTNDGSVFEIPASGPVEVRWNYIPAWWHLWAETENVPATIRVYRHGAPVGDPQHNVSPGWIFQNGPGHYRVDIDIEDADPGIAMILVQDPENPKTAEKE